MPTPTLTAIFLLGAIHSLCGGGVLLRQRPRAHAALRRPKHRNRSSVEEADETQLAAEDKEFFSAHPNEYILYPTWLPGSLKTPARRHAHPSYPSHPLLLSTYSTPRPLARIVHASSAHCLHCPDSRLKRPDPLLDAMGTRERKCSARSTVDPASALVPLGPHARFCLRLISTHTRLLDTPIHSST
ncbi:hypothetical protein HETIRDRAFT_451088 [Heterobasidion irregulare TC 32-1]|uniref:Uncharacterized protein n=1 Tax=Heterobasidion irregulare (strain TC 32-1) TaxID=747525 RepID=W4K7D7_HETIT|nr:uncharacterized protein HETIRDRAFT_451088 [Heterobasidion irregulare TC 32-1]ETW81245.1 hypothetical protein HETIRDRAFT_451088 [Heterobasidion irregulare TC 32-1]